MKVLDVHLAEPGGLLHGAGVGSAEALIRDAHESDAEAIAAIYGYHVLNGTASYDEEPPPPAFMLAKIRAVQEAGWPFIVADKEGDILGYAYVTQFRDRSAYRFTCENSIYAHPDWMGRGIGRALLEALIARSADCGFGTMIAVIGGAEPASVALHARCGFSEVGRLKGVGWKKERWLDSVYMQRAL